MNAWVYLEKFFCKSSHIIHMKRAHSDVVLAAQRMHQGNHRIEMIAKTSEKSSRCARERAAEVAALNAGLCTIDDEVA